MLKAARVLHEKFGSILMALESADNQTVPHYVSSV